MTVYEMRKKKTAEGSESFHGLSAEYTQTNNTIIPCQINSTPSVWMVGGAA